MSIMEDFEKRNRPPETDAEVLERLQCMNPDNEDLANVSFGLYQTYRAMNMSLLDAWQKTLETLLEMVQGG